MTKLVKQRKSNFTMINNDLFSMGLHAKAIGIFAYLWGRPDDWSFYETEITKHFADGRDSVRSAIKELEKHHLLVRVRTRENGRFTGYDWYIYEEPQEEETGKHVIGKSNIESHQFENHQLEKLHTTNTDSSKTEDTKIDDTKIERSLSHEIEKPRERETQIERIKSSYKYQFSQAVLDYAASYAEKVAQYPSSYLEKLLSNWAAEGIRSLDEVKQRIAGSATAHTVKKPVPEWLRKDYKPKVKPASEEQKKRVREKLERFRKDNYD